MNKLSEKVNFLNVVKVILTIFALVIIIRNFNIYGLLYSLWQ